MAHPYQFSCQAFSNETFRSTYLPLYSSTMMLSTRTSSASFLLKLSAIIMIPRCQPQNLNAGNLSVSLAHTIAGERVITAPVSSQLCSGQCCWPGLVCTESYRIWGLVLSVAWAACLLDWLSPTHTHTKLSEHTTIWCTTFRECDRLLLNATAARGHRCVKHQKNDNWQKHASIFKSTLKETA